MLVFLLLAAALVFVILEMTATFALAQRLRNFGVVDVVWSLGFTPIVWLYVALMGGRSYDPHFEVSPAWNWPAALTIAALVTVWSLRLGGHLFVRVKSHHPVEDVRYAKLRQEWGAQTDRKMLGFFLLQGALQVVLSLPWLLVVIDPQSVPAFTLAPLAWAGATIWLIGLVGESIADRQLAKFRGDSANKGKVCQAGLWNYSRHPNYFFEWLIWVGYAVFALGSPWGWLGLLAPALMWHFLVNVTGVPMTEELSLKSKGDAYRDYQRTTSAFVPWFKRKAEPVITVSAEDRALKGRLENERLLSAAAALWPEWQATKPSLRRIWIQKHLGASVAEGDLVAWAVEALCEGVETPSLCILAGLNPQHDAQEVHEYFEKSLRELGWSAPAYEATLIMYATDVAAELLEGKRTAQTVVSELYQVWWDLNYPSLLSTWNDLDDARFSEAPNYLSEEELTEAVRLEAVILIETIRSAASEHGVGPGT